MKALGAFAWVLVRLDLFGDIKMPALYPISVAAEDFKVGDNVRWFTTSQDVSPYVGKVVAISPKIYKVWVTWPIGDTVQMSPEELILVPKYDGLSVVPADNGYDSYDKQKSAEFFGTLGPTDRENNITKLAGAFKELVTTIEERADRAKQNQEVVASFVKKAADSVYADLALLKKAGRTQVSAYNTLYNKYACSLPDSLIRESVITLYSNP